MSDYDHSRSRTDSEVALRKIFIGGLSYGTDDDKLRKYFGVYGSVQDAVVMKDPVSRRSRGFGFITFSDIAAVDNALAHEPHTIDARKVEAKRAVPRSEVSRDTGGPSKLGPGISKPAGPGSASGPTSGLASPSQTQIQNESRHALDARINMDEYAYNKIFVGGLHYDTRDAEFRSYFERFGRVMSAEVMFNRETHKSRGFGFIVFELEKGAEQVCAEKEHVIDGKVVEVKRAIPRSRIGNNGTILPPSAAASRPIPAPTQPVRVEAPVVAAVKPHTAVPTPAVGVANSKIRQDMRRSASVGTPSSVVVAGKPAIVRQSQQSLAASIAAIGVPSPRAKQNATALSTAPIVPALPASRVVAGSSYAAALRTGAATEDSETSITDQLLIASLQSDLLQAQSSTNILYGGLFTDTPHTHPTSSVIERPPRSLSEPVIQLPQKMNADYFKNQLSLIQGRGGVAALGGAFNPVSPLQPSYGSMSPLQKAIRSPIMTALASPISPLPSLGLAWLSTPPSKQSDSAIDVLQITNTSGVVSGDLFPPLPPSNSNVNVNNMAPMGHQQLLSRQQDFQQLQYMQQQFLQQQMQQMQQQQAYYQQQLFNPSLVLNQQQMGMQGMQMIGQNGLYQGQQGQLGSDGVPSPLAWASMSTISGQQQQQQQQYFEPQQNFQNQFYAPQNQQQQYQYQQQQQQVYHMQMQQHLQGQGYNNMMGVTQNGIAFSSQQQFTPYTQEQQIQTQPQIPRNGSNNNVNSNNSNVNGNANGNANGSVSNGIAIASGGAAGSGSAGTSRSGSLIDGASIGQNGKNPDHSNNNNGNTNGNSGSGNSGSGSGGNRGEEKDELFLFEGLRLDGDAPEFEPQAQMAARGW